MDVVPERRQGPAQLRGLRNSPRAMPLFDYELVRPELTCKVEADQLHVKT